VLEKLTVSCWLRDVNKRELAAMKEIVPHRSDYLE